MPAGLLLDDHYCHFANSKTTVLLSHSVCTFYVYPFGLHQNKKGWTDEENYMGIFQK
jgi:hypothetical protein